jgi:hypothetical protein
MRNTPNMRNTRNSGWIAGASIGLAVMVVVTGCGGGHGKKPARKSTQTSRSAHAGVHKSRGLHNSPTSHRSHKSRTRHTSSASAPLSLSEARGALLDVGDMPVGWTKNEEHLDGRYHVQQNLFGMTAKSTSCQSFIDRTNRAIGTPRLAVERTLKEGGGAGEVTARVVGYRSAKYARRAMSQLRNVPGACPGGVVKDGVKVAFAPWRTERAGNETVGTRMGLGGMSFGDVLVRVGAATVELNFSKSGKADTALVSQLTHKAADRLRSAAR